MRTSRRFHAINIARWTLRTLESDDQLAERSTSSAQALTGQLGSVQIGLRSRQTRMVCVGLDTGMVSGVVNFP